MLVLYCLKPKSTQMKIQVDADGFWLRSIVTSSSSLRKCHEESSHKLNTIISEFMQRKEKEVIL